MATHQRCPHNAGPSYFAFTFDLAPHPADLDEWAPQVCQHLNQHQDLKPVSGVDHGELWQMVQTHQQQPQRLRELVWELGDTWMNWLIGPWVQHVHFHVWMHIQHLFHIWVGVHALYISWKGLQEWEWARSHQRGSWRSIGSCMESTEHGIETRVFICINQDTWFFSFLILWIRSEEELWKNFHVSAL